jgi:CheY-like chemotaxis protein
MTCSLSRIGGSGLGLFISRRLTEMHGGAIGFASKAKVGSTFAFYVKCRKSNNVPRNTSPSSATNLSIRTQASVLSNWSRDESDRPSSVGRKLGESKVAAAELHVLIVEDNLVNQRVLAKQLRNIGMKVAVANHGGEALQYLGSTRYCLADDPTANALSLILMDWEMPVMDGLTCVREIRQLQKQGIIRGHVPVIAVTANVRSEQVSQALKAGMDDVISKPFRIPELCTCIQKTIANTTNI